jgi:methylglutaconyl-CoA hydratase
MDSQKMNSDKVLCSIDQRGIATVTLNNPDKHNAFDDIIINQLNELFLNLAGQGNVRVVILAAKGKSFSAGADLNWMKRMATYSREENLIDAKALATVLHNLNTLPKPTIARVQGAAFGGGVGLLSCCDIAIASEKASFSLSEVKLGMVPATISPYVVDAIGPRAARRYFMTAERFDAATAEKIGLVSEVVTEKELDGRIDDITGMLLANGPTAVATAKQLLSDIAYQPIDAALIQKTSQLIADIRCSKEGQEGLSAFLEKRSPSWIATGITTEKDS